MNSENLTWEITPEEKRKRTEKALILWFGFLLFFVSYAMFHLLGESRSKEEFIERLYIAIFSVASVIVGFLISFLLNKKFHYPKIRYHLDSQGITIFKGNKKRYFLWKDFECFYIYTPVRSGQKQKIKESKIENFMKKLERKEEREIAKELGSKLIVTSEMSRRIEGEVFYLKKKQSGFLSKFYKTFVVIYSEPDNWQRVLKFLKKYLPQKPMETFTDAGLVFYEFK
jgi:hypothetical protein